MEKPGNPKEKESPEVSQSPAKGYESRLSERSRILVQAAKEREAARARLEQAMESNQAARPELSALLWRGFLALGAAALIYLLSWAFTDPLNFRHGASVLWRVAWQFALTLALWALGIRYYRNCTPEEKRALEKRIIFFSLCLLAFAIFFALGIFDRRGRMIWGNGRFLFLLLLQITVWTGLFLFRKNTRSGMEESGEKPLWKRLAVYSSEAGMIYLSFGILLQLFQRLDVQAVLRISLFSTPSAILFFTPFAGYVGLRKIVEEI